MFTFTGLQDKSANRLTQFVGFFLRPKKFLEDDQDDATTVTNGQSHTIMLC
jgi:hypothetical protein